MKIIEEIDNRRELFSLVAVAVISLITVLASLAIVAQQSHELQTERVARIQAEARAETLRDALGSPSVDGYRYDERYVVRLLYTYDNEAEAVERRAMIRELVR